MKEHKASIFHKNSNSDEECRNVSDCRWNKQGRCNFVHRSDAPNVENVKDCKHGEACKFKSQGRCNFYHKDVGVQMVRKPRNRVESSSSQSNTWRSNQQPQNTLPHDHQQNNSRPSVWIQNQKQRDNVPSMWQQRQQIQRSGQAQAWCQHGISCNLGQYCLLRHYSDEDFRQLQKQMRNKLQEKNIKITHKKHQKI